MHNWLWQLLPSQQFCEHCRPEHVPHAPHVLQAQVDEHVRVRSRDPAGQLPQSEDDTSTLPGAHNVCPPHAPHAPHAPQPQLALQVRLRLCEPLLQLPHP